LAVLALIATAACSSDEEEAVIAVDDNTAELLTTDAYVEATTSDEFQIGLDLDEGIDFAIDNLSVPQGTTTNGVNGNRCVTVTINGTRGQFPITYILDFGTGCTGPRGNTRAGILEVTYSNRLRVPGATLTITRTNYSFNGIGLGGTITYVNNGTALPDWTRTVTNGSLTRRNGDVYTFTSTRSVRTVSGSNTGPLRDNVYEIYAGSRTVNRPNNTSMTLSVATPILKPFTCRHAVSGTLNINGTNVNGVLDYGAGPCDNQATFTNSNGRVFPITLR
jgi:hypothetical protein